MSVNRYRNGIGSASGDDEDHRHKHMCNFVHYQAQLAKNVTGWSGKGAENLKDSPFPGLFPRHDRFSLKSRDAPAEDELSAIPVARGVMMTESPTAAALAVTPAVATAAAPSDATRCTRLFWAWLVARTAFWTVVTVVGVPNA